MTNTNTSRVEDFPNHHIGPRRHEAKAMLQTLGYNVSNYVPNRNDHIDKYKFLSSSLESGRVNGYGGAS